MEQEPSFVRVSPRDCRYLELSDGRPYIPIGPNLVGAPPPEDFEKVLGIFRQNRINYCRIWINRGCFLLEAERSGAFDETAAGHLDRFLALAGRHGVRVKLCLEHFRDITPNKTQFFDNTLHHRANGGPFADMLDFLQGERGIAQFKAKLAWCRKRIGDCPAVFAWELWNEMNCVGPTSVWASWTRTMLAELHRLFPSHLAVQSLGSFDKEEYRAMYAVLATLHGNDLAQVHRYLDLGAQWKVCHGPVDVLAAEAVRELQAFGAQKPVLLAESGAVEPCHSGPFALYGRDRDGMLLHDVLWAPFMAGAAGPGQIWHWDRYVHPLGIWWQYARFAEATAGFDPAGEAFEPLLLEQQRLRVYVLRGRRTLLAWCRDRENDWHAELQEQRPPERIAGEALDLEEVLPGVAEWSGRTYDPWTGAWEPAVARAGHAVFALPPFRRSIVLRLETPGPQPSV